MTSFSPSANIADLRESATIAVSTRAKALRAEGRAIIDLGAGEPDFPTPAYVMQAAREALEAGATRYTQVEGIRSLRDVLAARANAVRGANVFDADDIVVSAGTKQALFNAVFSLFGAGDEVLVPTPGWTSYYEMIGLSRATPIPVYGSRAQMLKVSADDLRAAATTRTRGLILNSPCNPTGAVYTRAELESILALADERGWWVLSDEIYRAIAYDHEAPSLLEVAPNLDRIVVVDGVAKSFAMTGWRIGWSIAPRHLSRAMGALQSHTTSNPATLSQHATLAALSNEAAARDSITAMVAELRRRRDAALRILGEAEIEVIPPAGAFYLYLRVGDAGADVAEPGTAFARRLLEAYDVAVVPGSAFRSPEWIRVSYAAPEAQVLEGVRRIIAARIS